MSDGFIYSAADFYPPPYTFEGLTCTTFQLESNDPQKLRAICDASLNYPLGKEGRFVLNSHNVLVTFSSFQEVESENNPAIGYLSYQEVSFIIMVYDTVKMEVGMFAPILFLDGPQSGNAEYFASWPIALGREVFGLAKTRGEIDLHPTDLTGELRSPYPSGLNTPLQLPQIVTVSFPAQKDKTEIVLELIEVEKQIELTPADSSLREKKKRLVDRLNDAKKKLRAIRSKPRVGARYHPIELVEKIWGASIADRRLMMNGEPRVAPIEIRDALHVVAERSVDHAQLEKATERGVEIGFFEALNMTVTQNSPWSAGLGFPLLGLRQLHEPGNFAMADHRDIIRSPFGIETPAEYADYAYVVDFLEPQFAARLGLKASYPVLASDTVVHRNGFARYGDEIDKVDPNAT